MEYAAWAQPLGQPFTYDSLDSKNRWTFITVFPGDLWNLLPALRSIDQRQKTDRLPYAERLPRPKSAKMSRALWLVRFSG